ncbi:MAG: porin family protein [Hyphomicrobiales bacterium]
MKKILLIALFALSAQFLSAQIHFGPKIGYSAAKLSTDQSEISSELKNSFTFGAFVRVGNKIYVQPEINFQTVGGIFEKPQKNNLSPFKDEVSLNTIEVPVLIGYKVLGIGVANLRVMGGPTANIVIDKSIKNKLNSYESVIKDKDINDIAWGLQLGAGFDVLMFTLDVRYNVGLSNAIKDINIGSTPIKLNSKSNVFTVSLGWKIL